MKIIMLLNYTVQLRVGILSNANSCFTTRTTPDVLGKAAKQSGD